MSKAKDITGNKYDKLTVLELVGSNKYGDALWKCLCDCGGIKIVLGKSLRNGDTKSCGCLQFPNLVGKRFGKLIVIRSLGSNKKFKQTFLECLCDCGKITAIRKACLKNGTTKSCGCLSRDGQYETIKKRTYKQHLNHAKERGYASHLTFEEYCEIASHCCVYCNTFSIRKNVSTGAEIKLNSVDRRDNETYYKLSNSQSTCFNCQEMKMDRTHQEFLDHLDCIFKHLKKINYSFSSS